MCSILGIFQREGITLQLRERAEKMTSLLRHRGPDEHGRYQDDSVILMHERLSVIDPATGKQPLHDMITGRVLIANGEIYNHKELHQKLREKHDWKTRSDCEILLYLYDEFGPSFLSGIDGIFSCILYDSMKKEIFIARDHLGIVPLYIGWDKKGVLYVASEMKAIEPYVDVVEEFPPGHYYYQGCFVQWYKPVWSSVIPSGFFSPEALRSALTDSVKRQMMSDVPFGVLISGGLDSSLIAAIAVRHSPTPLHSFSIGLKGSPDLLHARVVASFLGTIHHEFTFTIQEGIKALRDVIYHTETYDVTTIRASTPMFLMAHKIKGLGIKMVLSGEGSDEIFGGYLYFHMAPSKEELHWETLRKLQKLSRFDCLRANKSMAAWGIEVRVPFLGKDFLEYSMNLDPQGKMCRDASGKPRMEKWLLRTAFQGYVPDTVLWRQKEQFSDGVGYSWIDALKAHAEEQVTDEMVRDAPARFSIQPPTTKEAYLYRALFTDFFPSDSAARTVESGPSIACSSPTAYKWSKQFEGMADPSGRAVRVHEMAVKVV